MRLGQRLVKTLRQQVLPAPVNARHAEYSMLFSADDAASHPSPRLIELALDAIRCAQEISLSEITCRMNQPPYYAEIWPGESYKLLAGLVTVLKPRRVVEIGTGGGSSTLAMRHALPRDGRLVTFDVVEWRSATGSILREDDFLDGRLIQHTDDLCQPPMFERHRAVLEQAELFFIDAAKDGVMEQILLTLLRTVAFRTTPLLVFDDIRLWNMLKIWREITLPKLDLTSFGHWTGTGIVDWIPCADRTAAAALGTRTLSEPLGLPGTARSCLGQTSRHPA